MNVQPQDEANDLRPEWSSLVLRKHFDRYRLSEKQIEKLVRYGKSKWLQKGDRLILSGTNCPLYLVIQGKLKIVDCTDAEEFVITDILRADEFFGNVSLSSKAVSNQYAETIAVRTLVCLFYVPDVRHMIELDPFLALAFASSVGRKLRLLEARNRWFLHRKDTKSRLGDFFQSWAEQDGIRIGEKWVVNNDMTVSDIAGYISASRQTVHQILNEFRHSGYLEFSRKKIIISPARRLNSQHPM